MLKIAYRTLVILLAAGLVAGGLYLFVQNGGGSALAIGRGHADFPGGVAAAQMKERGQGLTPPDGASLHSNSLRGEHDQAGFNLTWRGLSGLLSPLMKIAGITLIVTGIQAVNKHLKRRRAHNITASAALPRSIQS